MLHLRNILKTDDRKHSLLTAKDSVHRDVPARLCVRKPGVRTEGTTGDRMGKKNLGKLRINRLRGGGVWWNVERWSGGTRRRENCIREGNMTFTKYNSGAMNFPESCYYAMGGKPLKAKATVESPDHWIPPGAVRMPSSSKLHPLILHYTNSQVPNYTTAKRALMARSLPGPPT